MNFICMKTNTISALNVCLDYSPAYGGVVKAIEDFQAVLSAKALSFDDETEGRVEREDVYYVDERSSILLVSVIFVLPLLHSAMLTNL